MSKKPIPPPSTLPTYDSITQCSGATGIPEAILKHAKKSGCPAFKSNRVYLEPLLRWLFSRGHAEGKTNWGEEFKKWRAKIEQTRYEQRAGELVVKANVDKVVRKVLASTFTILEQILVNEYPVAVAGLDVAEARVFGKRVLDKVMAEMQKLAVEWEGV